MHHICHCVRGHSCVVYCAALWLARQGFQLSLRGGTEPMPCIGPRGGVGGLHPVAVGSEALLNGAGCPGKFRTSVWGVLQQWCPTLVFWATTFVLVGHTSSPLEARPPEAGLPGLRNLNRGCGCSCGCLDQPSGKLCKGIVSSNGQLGNHACAL